MASQEAHEALDEWDRMNHLVDPDTIRFKMSEKEFQAQVVEMAKAFGWLVYHTWRSQLQDVVERLSSRIPGPTMVREGRIIFAELKT